MVYVLSVNWCCLSVFLSFCFQLKESVMCPVKPCRKRTIRLIDVTRALIGPPSNLCLFPLSISFSISASCRRHLTIPTRKTKCNFNIPYEFVVLTLKTHRLHSLIMFVGLFKSYRDLYFLPHISMFVCWTTSACIAFHQPSVACTSDVFIYLFIYLLIYFRFLTQLSNMCGKSAKCIIN